MHKILSIDDAPLFQAMLKETLTSAGYACVTARDAREGIALYEKEKPDCVLADITMPGMNGGTRCVKTT